MNSFNIGNEVYLRDRSVGKPLKVKGEIVGQLPRDRYAVLMRGGWNEGKIINYDYWELFLIDSEEEVL